jgi:peptidoglycan DL-endopeptidase CwlO
MMVKKALSFLLMLTFLISGLPRAYAENNRDEVVKMAKEQLGAPYRFGGTTPSGFDCSGFVQYVFDAVGIALPRTTSEQYETGVAVNKEDLLPGDLVFFKNTYKSGISHSGIYIGNDEFISATTSQGVSIASINNPYWGPKFAGGRRVIEEPLPPGQFYDVSPDHPAYQAISELGKAGIIHGFEGSYFKPDLPVTRGQAAAILNRYLKLPAPSTKSFSDVSLGMSFAKDIAAMKEAGIIFGYKDGTFRPYENITRTQMAVIIDRAFRLSQSPAIAGAAVKYNDVHPSFWAYPSIIAIKAVDRTEVFNSSSFHGGMDATRMAFASAVYSAIQASQK